MPHIFWTDGNIYKYSKSAVVEYGYKEKNETVLFQSQDLQIFTPFPLVPGTVET